MHIASSLANLKKQRRSPVSRTAGLFSVLAGILVTPGCGLKIDVIEPAPDGGPGLDATVDATSCAERISATGGRCEVPSLTCDAASGCPASWTEAQLASSCKNDASIVLATCGGAASWTSYHEFTVLACYYDPTSGRLKGFHEEADHLAYCGGSTSSRYVGDVPANCASDGGVYTAGFSCTGDGGLDQPVPCGNTTCAPGQFCRVPGPTPGTCSPPADSSGGACVAIPSTCAGVATCDCLAHALPACACCAPGGGGVFGCSGT